MAVTRTQDDRRAPVNTPGAFAGNALPVLVTINGKTILREGGGKAGKDVSTDPSAIPLAGKIAVGDQTALSVVAKALAKQTGGDYWAILKKLTAGYSSQKEKGELENGKVKMDLRPYFRAKKEPEQTVNREPQKKAKKAESTETPPSAAKKEARKQETLEKKPVAKEPRETVFYLNDLKAAATPGVQTPRVAATPSAASGQVNRSSIAASQQVDRGEVISAASEQQNRSPVTPAKFESLETAVAIKPENEAGPGRAVTPNRELQRKEQWLGRNVMDWVGATFDANVAAVKELQPGEIIQAKGTLLSSKTAGQAFYTAKAGDTLYTLVRKWADEQREELIKKGVKPVDGIFDLSTDALVDIVDEYRAANPMVKLKSGESFNRVRPDGSTYVLEQGEPINLSEVFGNKAYFDKVVQQLREDGWKEKEIFIRGSRPAAEERTEKAAAAATASSPHEIDRSGTGLYGIPKSTIRKFGYSHTLSPSEVREIIDYVGGHLKAKAGSGRHVPPTIIGVGQMETESSRAWMMLGDAKEIGIAQIKEGTGKEMWKKGPLPPDLIAKANVLSKRLNAALPEGFEKFAIPEITASSQFQRNFLFNPIIGAYLRGLYMMSLHERVENRIDNGSAHSAAGKNLPELTESWRVTLACYNRGFGGYMNRFDRSPKEARHSEAKGNQYVGHVVSNSVRMRRELQTGHYASAGVLKGVF